MSSQPSSLTMALIKSGQVLQRLMSRHLSLGTLLRERVQAKYTLVMRQLKGDTMPDSSALY